LKKKTGGAGGAYIGYFNKDPKRKTEADSIVVNNSFLKKGEGSTSSRPRISVNVDDIASNKVSNQAKGLANAFGNNYGQFDELASTSNMKDAMLIK